MFGRKVLVTAAVVAAMLLVLSGSAYGAVTRYEETTPPPMLTYVGTWTSAAGADFSGGYVRYNTVAGNSATFTFTGTGVDWFAARSTVQHVAEVFLDGVSQGTFDLYGPVRTGNQLIWGVRGLPNTTHTVRIVNVTPYVNIDAFDVYTPSDITASAGPNGSISPSGVVTVDHGANQEFVITPDPGYQVADVVVDGASVGAVTSYLFSNVTGPHTITASFSLLPVVSTRASSPWSLALALVAAGAAVLAFRAGARRHA